jgi:hypothetical protein
MREMHWDYQQLQRCPASRFREIVRQLSERADAE